MPAEYKFRLYHPSTGAFQAEFIDVKVFSYLKVVNDVGMMTLDVHPDHQIIAFLNDSRDNQLEVWRRNPDYGITWHRDYIGLFRDENWSEAGTKKETVRLFFPDGNHLLWRPIVAYPAEILNRSEFVAKSVETIMNSIVKYNATLAGTTVDGRIVKVEDWATNISVEADGAFGNSIGLMCHGRRLISVLQEITRQAPGDFNMVKTGANTWQYRFYEQQLGADRAATVTFSRELGNMKDPKYFKGRMNELTRAIVGGAGKGEDRKFYVRNPAYTHYDKDDNCIEYWVDAGDAETDDEAEAAGDAMAWETRAASRFEFEVQQTEGYQYGPQANGGDYELGDLILASAWEFNSSMKLVKVQISMDGTGHEVIKHVFEDD